MNIYQKRLFDTGEETISILYLDGKFACWILEDQFRTTKVYADTRIPAGKYRLELRKEGSHHIRYAKKFPDMHRGMVHLLGVPKFKYILLHIGNTDKDTAGCLLCGDYPHPKDSERYNIVNSTVAYKRIYPLIAEAIWDGDTYWEIDDPYE